jgi:hypothetical protein
LRGPTNIWFDDNGDLLVSDYSGTAIKRFDSSGVYLGDFIQGLSQSEGVDFFPNGDILIGNGASSSVKMYEENGTYIKDLIPSGSGALQTPNAVVIREVNPEAGFQNNPGLIDAWFDPVKSGQGFFIVVFPLEKQVFLAWFTYDTERPAPDVTAVLGEPGHRWLTALGPYDGSTATLTIFNTTGGIIEFTDCTAGLVTYKITSLNISGQFPIQRIVADNVPLCDLLNEQLQQVR